MIIVRLKNIKLPLPQLALFAFLLILAFGQGTSYSVINNTTGWRVRDKSVSVEEITKQVLPDEGFRTKIILGDAVTKAVAAGIIDVSKVEALYAGRGGIPKEMSSLLLEESTVPLTVNSDNATWLVNILWPIGMANYMEVNSQSAIGGFYVDKWASTGGWTLGKAKSGGVYFNKYPLITLKPAQESRVKSLAENVYRPCCNNSAFFQDCNHGSAALALIELGVSQGLSDNEIYQAVLRFNSFWFPQNYTQTAIYFRAIKKTAWDKIDPSVVLSKEFSSISGYQNVKLAVNKLQPVQPVTLRKQLQDRDTQIQCGNSFSSCAGCGSGGSCATCGSGCGSGGSCAS